MRAMGGGEEVGRGGFTCEEQPAIDGRGEHGALAGVPGQGMRIGAAGEAIERPARFLQRLQSSSKIAAEKRDDLVDRLCGDRAVPGLFQASRKISAEKAFDAGLAERA